LATYGLCALVVFRLLRRALADDRLACLWAGVAAVTMPTTAFAFQLYPELVASVLIVTATTYALFATEPSNAEASLTATASAALVWLPPRFLLVSVTLAVLGLWRSPARARPGFAIAYALTFGSVLAFQYRVTGSFLPTAMYDVASPEGSVNPAAIPVNLAAYALDRHWGLIPNAPILLLVCPGMAFLARSSPRDAAALLAIGLSLAVTAAGHSVSAAGTTPGRLVLAVVPLAV